MLRKGQEEGCSGGAGTRSSPPEISVRWFHVRAGFEEPLTHTPQWPWARFNNPEFRRRANSKILTAVENWSPDKGSLLLCGETGAAKSASVLAWLYRMRDQAIAKARAGEKASIVSFAWITGPELSGCRRRTKIGQESPIVKLALKHYVLILDELGFEPPCEELFFVLDHRLRMEAPVVVTSGRKLEELMARYGDALVRRLIQQGTLVEGHKRDQ